jgi:quercetin dioxygenase-like cupin family protein
MNSIFLFIITSKHNASIVIIHIMPFINFNTNKVVKIWDGIYGTLAHSEKQTFGHFTIDANTVLPAHSHPHEQWSHVLEGELEFDIDGEKMLLTPGMTAYIPSNAPHSAIAHTQCKVIDCFTPARQDFIELEKNAE